MDVSFYLSLERYSWSFSDWDMKPEHLSIPSPSCAPKGRPAACLSKDTPGTHIRTKHSSQRTAAGTLQCPSVQPDLHSISGEFQRCTTPLKQSQRCCHLSQSCTILIRIGFLCCFNIFCFSLRTWVSISPLFPILSAGWSNTCICSFFNPPRSERENRTTLA